MYESSIHIQIAKPCHENWQHMTPNERGRFCGQCQKTVVDFTVMTDAEIVSFFQQQNGQTCGRFFNHQLQREVTVIKPKATMRLKWWWAAFISGVLFAAKAKAQRPATYGDTVVVTGYKSQKQFTTTGVIAAASQVLKGRVIDENGEPMAGATILVTGTMYTAIANEQGAFSINIPASMSKARLKVSYIGYEEKQQKIDWINGLPNGGEKVDIVLANADMQLTGEVVIAGYVTVKPSKSALQWNMFKKKSTCSENVLYAFPNPVYAQSFVSLKGLPEGKYSITLKNMLGATLSVYKTEVLNSSSVVAWQMPLAVAGKYVIQAIQEGSNKIFTTNIVLLESR